MTREIKITPPEGFEIDREHSTFDCIKFKRIVKKRWRDVNHPITGYVTNRYMDDHIRASIATGDSCIDTNIFATEKQAKSSLAMAQISQIMVNDDRFGGVVTDEEYANKNIWKYSINRRCNTIEKYSGTRGIDHFLSFHTPEQRDLFLEENEDLVKDYLMIK